MTIQQLLIKYWGHKTFRPLQEEIINSVMEGRDTLALMPTGGGKSVCYQLPALAKEGICLVITPLIALMRDQVEQLKKKNINAVAIYSGMSKSEIDIAFDNCIYRDVKLLYMSPERLGSEIGIARIRKMNVNLIAVDEAHCISQWGYDFRPPYLRIAEIRQYHPNVPVLALTATATSDVIKDIQSKLEFKRENVFSVSFERKNLIYNVSDEGDKNLRLLKFIKREQGQGLIYVMSRLRTSQISDFLNNNNISATFYHAGLEQKVRSKRQDDWFRGKTRIIACTSAFGMGIDKPDVRFVVHYDPVESLEEYYQQAGRAGRDGKNSFAILLYSEADKYELEKNLNIRFPGIDKIKQIYHALGNYFQIPIGGGQDVSFDFDIKDFSNNYDFETLVVYNSLKFLEREGYLMLTESYHSASRIHFLMNKETLYTFQVENKQYDNFIKEILRLYGGVFNDFVDIFETDLAYKIKTTKENVKKLLEKLHRLNVLEYKPQKNKPQIIYCKARLDTEDLYISKENYADRKKIAEEKLGAFIEYATNSHKCRSQLILTYFGEDNAKRCGACDVCLKRNELDLNEIEFDTVINNIKPQLMKQPLTMNEILAMAENTNEFKIIKVIRWLRENGKINMNTDNKFEWSQ